MNVVVVATDRSCPAALALRAEEVDAEVMVVEGDYDYGHILTDAWKNGGFILVEQDVVPWPGALAALEACSEDFCGYGYPMRNNGNLIYSLGCVKFSCKMTSEHPSLPEHWRDAHWSGLDGHVFAAIADKYGLEDFHVHQPPLAHVRDYP